jgi:hypothetical protein
MRGEMKATDAIRRSKEYGPLPKSRFLAQDLRIPDDGDQ